MDEPTEGIQPNNVQQIGDIILKLNKEENIAVILVDGEGLSHDVSENSLSQL